MSVNKVIYGGLALIDLTGDTVTADSLEKGKTAHAQTGEKIVGTLSKSNFSVAQKAGDIVYRTNPPLSYFDVPVMLKVPDKKTIVQNSDASTLPLSTVFFGNAKPEEVLKGKRFSSQNGLNLTGTLEASAPFNIQRLTSESTKLNFTANKVWVFGYGKTDTALYAFHGNIISYKTATGNKTKTVPSGFNVVNNLVNLTIANLTEIDVVVIDVNSV